MRLFASHSDSALPGIQANAAEFTPQPNHWVKLRDSLTPFSYDEALLLCQESADRWVAWVPDFGEVVLDRAQFYSVAGVV